MTGQAHALAQRRIALVGSTSWFLNKFCANTIRALRGRGAHVICIAPTDATSVSLIEELGAEHISFDLDFDGYNPFKELRSFGKLLLILARRRPDFVFNFTIKPNIYAGIACRLLRLPYANNVTGLGMAIASGGSRARLIEPLYKFTSWGAARVFVQNPDDLTFMQQRRWLDHTPITETPGLGVDLDRFRPQHPPPPVPPTFVMISRLQADKGVREFVYAARKVRRQRPDTRFVLVGSTEHVNRSAISDEELAAWRAEGVVEVPGAAADVRPWLAACHALVLPSHGEGMPTVVMEAAASARPAIVSDVRGCRHAVIDGRTGFICAPRNSEALAATMEKFLALSAAERDAMGRAARTLAEEHFSDRIVIDAYLDCLAAHAPAGSG